MPLKPSHILDAVGICLASTLNACLAADPDATHALIETRVPCNKAVETATALVPQDNGDGTLSLGPLGLLNGVFGSYPGRVVAHYDDAGKLVRFSYEVSP